MLEFLETLQNSVLGLVDSSWGLLVMGLLAMGDALIPPLPSGTLVSAMGAASANPDSKNPVWLIILVAAVCALLGDILVYFIGRAVKVKPNGKFGSTMAFFQTQFDQHWQIILSTARFIPVVRVAAFLAAGAVKVPWKRVALMDSVAAITWAVVYTLSGRLGGSLVDNPMVGMLLGVVVGAIAGLTIAKAAQLIQNRRMPTAQVEPEATPAFIEGSLAQK